MQEELDSVQRKIKIRKVARLDEIPPEVWKTREFDDILLRYCNAVYNQNTIDRWAKGCILPFPKKGDLGIAKNYQGITLTFTATKIYNAILRNRIETKLRKSIHDITNFDYPSNSRRSSCKKTSKQFYYWSTTLRPSIPYTKKRWSKYFSPTAFPKKLLQP